MLIKHKSNRQVKTCSKPKLIVKQTTNSFFQHLFPISVSQYFLSNGSSQKKYILWKAWNSQKSFWHFKQLCTVSSRLVYIHKYWRETGQNSQKQTNNTIKYKTWVEREKTFLESKKGIIRKNYKTSNYTTSIQHSKGEKGTFLQCTSFKVQRKKKGK